MSTSGIKLSVIIPTYKPKDYFWECLQSLVDQTIDRSLFEIIIVLNGCSEPFLDTIEEYIINNLIQLNVVLLHVEEAGVSNARNMAIEVAKGEYICFIDDDDYISPTYLDELLSKASPSTVVLSNAVSFNDITKKRVEDLVYRKLFIKYSNANSVTLNNVRQYLSCPVMKIIPKSIIADDRFDKRFVNGEDVLFIFKISKRIANIKFTSDKAIYNIRVRENSATTRTRTVFKKMINSLKLIIVITKCYLNDINNYSFFFYATRVLGLAKPRGIHISSR